MTLNMMITSTRMEEGCSRIKRSKTENCLKAASIFIQFPVDLTANSLVEGERHDIRSNVGAFCAMLKFQSHSKMPNQSMTRCYKAVVPFNLLSSDARKCFWKIGRNVEVCQLLKTCFVQFFK